MCDLFGRLAGAFVVPLGAQLSWGIVAISRDALDSRNRHGHTQEIVAFTRLELQPSKPSVASLLTHPLPRGVLPGPGLARAHSQTAERAHSAAAMGLARLLQLFADQAGGTLGVRVPAPVSCVLLRVPDVFLKGSSSIMLTQSQFLLGLVQPQSKLCVCVSLFLQGM